MAQMQPPAFPVSDLRKQAEPLPDTLESLSTVSEDPTERSFTGNITLETQGCMCGRQI